MLLLPADDDSILAVAAMLRRGRLVAFPTEMADNPLIVHVASPEGLATVGTSISPLVQDLADRFWRGR